MESIMNVFGDIFFLVVCLMLSGFFSGAETALFSLSQIHIERMGVRYPLRRKMVEKLLSDPARLLATILLGNTLVNVITSSMGYRVAGYFGAGLAAPLAIPFTTLLILILGEIVPKLAAVQHNQSFAGLTAYVISLLSYVLSPIGTFLNRVAEGMARLLGLGGGGESASLSEEEFRSIFSIVQEEGILHNTEAELIHRVFDLSENNAADVMVPRVDMVGLDLQAGDEQVLRSLARQARHRRLPVFDSSPDHVVGILPVRSLLLDENITIRDAMIPPEFVPETITLDLLLARMQKHNDPMAIVVDEYGGTAGLVTLEDVLEEVVGEILDEFDREEPAIRMESPWVYRVDGRVHLDDFNDAFFCDLHAEGVDTIGGFFTAISGRVPVQGDRLEIGDICLQALRVRGHRLKILLVHRSGGAEPLDGGKSADQPKGGAEA
jgi:putative hemolysin